MKVKNLKVRTPSIPSRTAANQFVDQHGYDIEWVPAQQLFYIHDTEKKQLHVVHMDEVTHFTLAVQPIAFMEQLRDFLATVPAKEPGDMEPATTKDPVKRRTKDAETV